jgi:transposase
MGTSDPQPSMFDHINFEQFVTADHPMQKIRPLIDTARIRQLCEPLSAEVGRPSIPPEPLFLALLGGYLLGVTSERALVRELTGHLVLRWFVGLDLDTDTWDHSTFSQNRKRRFTKSGLLEQLFDETVAGTITQKVLTHHTTLDGTLVQANASHKSFVPIEVFLKPEDYKKRIRSLDQTPDSDPGNPTITFRGEPRSNQTHI